MRDDGKRHACHSRNRGCPACRRIQNRSASDPSAIRHYASRLVSGYLYSDHLSMGMDLDAHAIACARITPYHRVMADDAAGRMVEARENRVSSGCPHLDTGDQLPDLVASDQHAVYAEQLVVLGAHTEADDARVVVRQSEVAALAEH